MKKLLTVLMITGLFGFASCGNAEQAATDAGAAVDSAAAVVTETATDAAAVVDTAVAVVDSALAQ